MIGNRERLERASRFFEMPEPAMDRLVLRRDRRNRNQRIAAAALALMLVTVGVALFARAVLSPAARPSLPFGEGSQRTIVREFSPTLSFVAPDTRGWRLHETYWNDNDLHIGGTERNARIWVALDAQIATHDCLEERTRVGTAEDLVSWVTTYPALQTTDPVPVSVGGLDGWRVDFGVDPARSGPCSGRVPVLAVPAWSYPFHGWRLGSDEQARLYALQLPATHGSGVITIVITETAHEFPQALADALPVIESFAFDLSGSDR